MPARPTWKRSSAAKKPTSSGCCSPFVTAIATAGRSVGSGPAFHLPISTSRTPCADIKAPHHAYVVVQHMSGDWIQRCIGFAPTYIDGQTIMDRSGIQYQVQYLEAGKAVCQVDLEPRQYRECVPPNSPRWALFIESHGRWSTAPG